MSRTLERTLGLRDLILITVGVVIGSGIFIVPAAVLRQTGGDPAVSMVVWALAGILSLLGALTYGELSATRPEAGGIYVYLRDGFGPFPAFLYGWTLFFVIASGSVATLAVAFTAYLGQLVPLTPVLAKLAALLMIAAIAVINVVGTRRSVSVNTLTTGFKVLAILVMSVALIVAEKPETAATGTAEAPAALTGWALMSGAGAATIGVLWAYEGWQYATFSAGETIRPQRNFPLGIAIGTAALIFIYCFANFAYIAALGPAEAARSNSIAATAVSAVFGAIAGKLIAGAILVSIFSAANTNVLTSPRVFYAMARDGLFFRRLAEIHPHFGTPAIAIVASSLWAAVLALSGTFEQLLTYVIFTGWLFYALAAASIFMYRRRDPEADRPFRVPGYPLTPLLFVLAAAAIVINALFTQTLTAVVGLGIVFLGAPAYLFWKRRPSGPVFPS
jgi:APA family basic amino acid/polyamine antiporter